MSRRIADFQHFPLLFAAGQADLAQVMQGRAAQGTGHWRAPADQAGRGVLLVIADEGENQAIVVLVRDFHRGAEEHAGLVRLAVGIEGIEDILADLEQGFAAAGSVGGADRKAALV